MKLTRDEAFKLNKSLNELDAKKYSKYFLLALTDAKKTLKVVVDEIDSRVHGLSFPEQETLMRERLEIIKKYAVKNEDGNVKVINEQVEFLNNDGVICQNEIDELFKKNQDVIDKGNQLNKEFEKYIMEEIEVNFFKVKFEYFPSDLDETTYNLLDVFRKESIEEILG